MHFLPLPIIKNLNFPFPIKEAIRENTCKWAGKDMGKREGDILLKNMDIFTVFVL
jgi:hypothetical protein